MEVAHLYRNIGKDLSHASFPIQDDALENEALHFQLFPCVPIHLCILASHERPENILAELRRPKYEYAVASGKERNVGDEDDGLSLDGAMLWIRRVQLFLNPRDASAILLSKLREGLLVPHVFFPKNRVSSLRLLHALEAPATEETFVPLDTSSFSVFFGIARTAFGTLFL